MSITSTATARADRETGQTHSGKRARRNKMIWAAQVLLAAVFVFAAMPKLADAHSAVAMFGQIGAGQWLRYLVGTAELAGAIGLLIPPAGRARRRRARRRHGRRDHHQHRRPA
ncbi:MAG TPA: DoxX family protein [Streptosporangiaceae bacterium]|jgi:hypothetical protein|nr:DoxX family protein [Streptosporangiaceae bacterium]